MANKTKLKLLAGETLVYGLPTVFLRLLSFITVPIFTRLLAPADYGLLGMTTSMSSLVVLVLMLGLDAATMILFFNAKDEEDRIRTVASWIFPYFLISAFGSVLFCAFSAPLAVSFLGGEKNRDLICVIAAAQFLTGLTTVSSLLMRLERRKWGVVSLAFSQGVTSTVCSIVLVAVFKFGVRGIYYSQLVTGAIFFFVNLLIMRRWLKLRMFSWLRFRELLKLGVPVMPAYLSFWIVSLMDRFFVQHYRGLSDVGLINVAQSLTMAVAFICQAFQQAVNPFALSIKDDPEAGKIYSQILTYFLLLTSSAAIALSIFAPEILSILTPKSFHAAGDVVAFYAFGAISGGVAFIAGIGINISKQTHHVGWTSLVAAGVNVALNFLLVPKYGMIGSAISSLTAQWLGVGLLFMMAQRCHVIPYRIGDVAVILTASFLVIALSHFGIAGGRVHTVFYKLGCLVLFFLAILIFRVVTTKQLTGLLTEARAMIGLQRAGAPTT